MSNHECRCEWCVKWSPFIQRTMKYLPSLDRALFEELVDSWMALQEDHQVLELKLSGEWPRWEFTKEALKNHSGK